MQVPAQRAAEACHCYCNYAISRNRYAKWGLLIEKLHSPQVLPWFVVEISEYVVNPIVFDQPPFENCSNQVEMRLVLETLEAPGSLFGQPD